MNTSLSRESDSGARSRWVCRVARQWCGVFGERHSRHVASCADCQVYFRAGAALETALRLEARQLASAVPLSDGFERRLLQAVRRAASENAPARQSAWTGAWAVGGVASAAVLAIIAVFFNRTSDTFDRSGLVGATAATDAAVIVDAVESLSNQLVDSVIPSAGKLVAANPLQHEIGSVYSDMRSALDFLALNFLPTARSAPAPSRTI